MKKEFLNNLSRTFHKVGFKLKKHSPAILVTAGVVGVVASTVMACKATTKLDETLDVDRKDIEDIHADMQAGILDEKEGKKELVTAYMKASGKVIKLYAPAVAVGTLSIGSIVASHGIMSKRNAAISAAYAVVNSGFKDYRKRVKERFGDRVDYELKNNITQEEIKTVETDEKGNTKEVTKKVDVVTTQDDYEYSTYARCFCELNDYWKDDANYNLMFLNAQQAYANDKLKRNGWVCLNEVYEMLGFEKTKEGQAVGWIYDKENPVGDNFIDFGIYDIRKRNCREFVNGLEKAIWLDFNVDGNILDLMK